MSSGSLAELLGPCLVFGGAGWTGRALIEALREAGVEATSADLVEHPSAASRCCDIADAEAVRAVVAELEPVRTRYLELMNDRGELTRLLRVGADKARSVASATLDRVHTAIGMLPA